MKQFLLDILDLLEERGQKYGPMRINLERIAQQWSVTLQKEVSPAQVALCMAQL